MAINNKDVLSPIHLRVNFNKTICFQYYSLNIIIDIVCDWISGAPIATTFSQYDTVPGEKHCVYKCSTESKKDHSINGVLYMNNTCYCVFDMYDVDEKIQGQKSCFLPTKGFYTTSCLYYIIFSKF